MITGPYITIYTEKEDTQRWFGATLTIATLLFSKHLNLNKRLSRTRVNIRFRDENSIRTLGSIKMVGMAVNIDTSKDLADIDKINLLLKIIFDALCAYGKTADWDLQLIEKAYKLSIADKGKFVWHSKLKSNKNRNLKARIRVSLDYRDSTVFFNQPRVPVIAEFFDNKSNFLFEVLIIDTFLSNLNWEKTFINPSWLDNETFGYDLINSQLKIFADVQSRQSNTVITRKEWGMEEIEGELRGLTYRSFSNDKELAEWINR